MMKPEDILNHVRLRLDGFEAVSEPIPLSGGLINYVWRIEGRPQNVVVKYAPPYVAVLPDVALDPARLKFEARSLRVFGLGGELSELVNDAFRPPLLLDFADQESIIILEDVGQHHDLGYRLRDEPDNALVTSDLGLLIGNFIGALHGQTCGIEAFQHNFNNFTIQRERLSGQYSAIGGYLKRGRVSDADALGQRALDMGQRLQKPGRCLTMGDLWPPSILITDNGLRIIDWEFSHFGLPGQDLGHFAAHLWMHNHQATSAVKAEQIKVQLDNFFQGYQAGLGARFEDLFGLQSIRDCAIHFGAEVLARTVGVYQSGYLYDGLPLQSSAIQEAVQVAAEYIRFPESTEIFATLTG